MKYSYNWLKELTKTKKSAQELAEMVMLKGFELEQVEDLGRKFDNIFVGQILEIKPHPNADRLQLTKVDVGEKGELEIVCGAKNIKVGDKVPVALDGAIIPKENFQIKKTNIRGVESNGMLCAEDELQLGKDHSGIIILDKDVKVGQPIAQALELEDQVVEFDVLPNRAHDCLSYEGMAREICAMEGREMDDCFKSFKPNSNGNSLKIEIKDRKLCPRYIGAVLTDVEIKPSPRWLQNRLIASGMEPINNVVDITNYVMLEVGNPLHAFDFEKVAGKIIIRKAQKDEKLELLDETKLALDENDLVITDPEKVLALAGIKGGLHSGINPQTSRIILEAANFDFFNIRKTRQRHGLSTESQARFEKGISPQLAEKAAARAIELLQKYAGAKLETWQDENYASDKASTIELQYETVNNLLGEEIEEKQILKILGNLGFIIVKKKADSVKLEIPYWRLDIEGPEDLAEEVGRIIGYEKIDPQAIMTELSVPQKNQTRQFQWKIRDVFTGLGFDEMVNYSFYSKKDAEVCKLDSSHLELQNPLSMELALMRKTLLVGILKNVESNARYFDEFEIFEVGKIYEMNSEEASQEINQISGAVFSKSVKGEDLFLNLKGKIQAAISSLTKSKAEFVEMTKEGSIFNSSRSAEIKLNGQSVGFIGEAEKSVAKFYGIKGDAVLFDLDFEKLFALQEKTVAYCPPRKFPSVSRDLSMFVAGKVKVDEIEKIIKQSGGDLLLESYLFDVYVDKQAGKKSLAFHMEFGSNERTLNSEEAEQAVEGIIKELENFGAEVRKG